MSTYCTPAAAPAYDFDSCPPSPGRVPFFALHDTDTGAMTDYTAALEWTTDEGTNTVFPYPNSKGGFNGGDPDTSEGFGFAFEYVTGRVQNLSMRIQNLVGNMAHWNAQQKRTDLSVVWCDMNYNGYLSTVPVSIKVNPVIEETTAGGQYFTITLTWSDGLELPTPVGLIPTAVAKNL